MCVVFVCCRCVGCPVVVCWCLLWCVFACVCVYLFVHLYVWCVLFVCVCDLGMCLLVGCIIVVLGVLHFGLLCLCDLHCLLVVVCLCVFDVCLLLLCVCMFGWLVV